MTVAEGYSNGRWLEAKPRCSINKSLTPVDPLVTLFLGVYHVYRVGDYRRLIGGRSNAETGLGPGLGSSLGRAHAHVHCTLSLKMDVRTSLITIR